MRLRENLRVLVALSVASVVVVAAPAGATIKCRQTVAKSLAGFIQAKTKALQKCEESVLKGKIAGPCPDSAATDKINKAAAKITADIPKSCCGKDKICGNADDASGEFGFARCPNVDSPGRPASNCGSILISEPADIAACLSCIGSEEASSAIALYYGTLATSTPGDDLNKCEVTIGKSVAKFLGAKSKALQKCEDGKLKGKILENCPDSVKAGPAIAKAESKKEAGICKACGGDDKLCSSKVCRPGSPANVGNACANNAQCNQCSAGNVGAACDVNANCNVCLAGANIGQPCPEGTRDCFNAACGSGVCQTGGVCAGEGDFTAADVGLNIQCPAVASSTPNFTGAMQSIQDVIACLDGVTEQRVDCADAFGTTSIIPFPPSYCSNHPTACTGSAGPKTVEVSIGLPAGVDIGGVSVALGYQNANLPGSGELDLLTGPVTVIQSNGSITINDLDDQVIVSLVGTDPLVDGPFFDANFSQCVALTAADLSCVVRDASDINGNTVLEGVTCSVALL